MISLEISYLFLQQYWWFIISFLAAALVFLMFVQGGQTLIYCIANNKNEQDLIVNTLGRKWELTFTTLVVFGGAFFASFPLFYSTSFGGAYWAWTALLLVFTIQAISYEYRSKKGNIFGHKFFETLLIINGLFGTILLGTIVGTMFNGADFSLNNLNNMTWHNNTRGLEALLNWHNISLGLAIFFLTRILGLLYFIMTIDNTNIVEKSKKKLLVNTIPFLIFFLTFLLKLFLKEGFALNSEGIISMEKYKYFNNFIQMPLIAIMFLIGVLAVIFGIGKTYFNKSKYDQGFWLVGIGAFLTVLSLFLILGYNNTAFYPSKFDIQSSLTIQNASSSLFTLKVMSIVSLFIPVVIAYIIIVWRAMNKNKISEKEINNNNEIIY